MSDTQQPTDSIGWKIVQKHAPFFKPSDLAKAIDDAAQLECKQAKQQTCDDIVELLRSQIEGSKQTPVEDPGFDDLCSSCQVYIDEYDSCNCSINNDCRTATIKAINEYRATLTQDTKGKQRTAIFN